MNDPNEKHIPSMSEVPDMDDTVKILFGIAPEGEEVVICEEEEGEE